MKKLVSALALAGAATPAAFAQSSVTLYGILDSNVRYQHDAGGSASPRWQLEDGAYSGPRWGVRGSEDLGNGLRGIFTLEAGFDVGTGAPQQASGSANFGETAAPQGRAFGRESWVGLTQEGPGTIMFGRYYTFAHLISNRFQANSNPNMNSLSVFSGHHRARQDNMVTYTNRIGGFGFGVQHAFGEQANNADGNSSNSVYVSYEGGPLFVGAYASKLHNLGDTDTRRILGAGGSYKVASFAQLFAGYMKRDQEVSVQENKVWTAAVNFFLTPALTLTLSHITDNQSGSAALAGARKVDYVGLDYALSKRTDVYAILDRNKVTGGYTPPANMTAAGRQTGLSTGIRHRF